ncbi:MAG: hypothetical protein JW940_35250 [Polyangiaceae bacterium]|nr:hypothetical protein [Polyangiaceae bacterium]
MNGHSAVAGALVALALLGIGSASASPEPTPTSLARTIAEARRLEQSGKPDVAIERLKSAREHHRSSETLVLALAAAYLADHNPFWALNVLSEHSATYPPACQARAWAAWVQIGQANLDEAEVWLETDECSEPPELRARFLVLRALIAHHRQRASEAAVLLARARGVGHLYAEDRELLDHLSARYQPGRLPLLSFSLELAAGVTSNGLAGVPVDTQSRVDADSTVVLLGAYARVVGSNSGLVRPVFELDARAQELVRDAVQDYSYRQLALRPGVLLGRRIPRLELRYAVEAVQLQGGDRYQSGPVWYSEAHRGEYELEATHNLSVFGGAGYRLIRDRARTRFELDEGAVWGTPLGAGTNLIVGASARWYSARVSAYTELGATALAQLDMRLPSQLGLRVNASLSGDAYPHSEGYFPSAADRERSEMLTRASGGLWWPAASPLRGGIEYAYTRRDSTATDYSYIDHRALLRIQWSDDSDRLGTTTVPREGRVTLETGLRGSASRGPTGTSVRELLRQDESAQRSSSCLK